MPVPETIVGIDPGLHGALALVTISGELLDIADMPIRPDRDGARPSVDAPGLATILRRWSPARAFIELVISLPSDGRLGSFAFGRCRGAIEGVLSGLTIPFESLPPRLWKRTIGIEPGRDQKATARAMAAKRWPSFADRFHRVMDADRAEAALVAVAGLELTG